jgi:hypothetical protein
MALSIDSGYKAECRAFFKNSSRFSNLVRAGLSTNVPHSTELELYYFEDEGSTAP